MIGITTTGPPHTEDVAEHTGAATAGTLATHLHYEYPIREFREFKTHQEKLQSRNQDNKFLQQRLLNKHPRP